jgi:ribosomal protein L11 methyltransferase
MADYVALTIDIPDDLAEHAAFLLHEAGAGGVEVRDAEQLPPPGLSGPPPRRAVVIGYFDGSADGDEIEAEIRTDLERQADGREIRSGVARLAEENWAETWKLHFQPILAADRLWVLPPWEARRDDRPAVVIEPGMAFGTGGHATTLLCLEALVEALGRRPGASVLDVGCGSGILGIGARLLGAGRVAMIDNDPVAVEVARENAAKNGVPGLETSGTPVAELPGTFDLVVANILANPLVELAAPIAARVAEGGELYLSGILGTQADEVAAAYRSRGFGTVARRDRGEWALLRLGREP